MLVTGMARYDLAKLTYYKQWKTEISALRFSGNQHTLISTFILTLGVIKTLQHGAKEVPTKIQETKKDQEHLKTALRTCGYPGWAFSKTSRKRDPKKEEDRSKHYSISIPYLSGVLEKFRRILQKHDIPVQFKPFNTLRQRLVHPKDKTPRHKQQCRLGHTEPERMQ